MTMAARILHTTTLMICVCVNAVHLPLVRKQGVAHAWTSVPDTNITFSSSFCCNETSEMENVLRSIEALRFCFTDVLLIVDVPHSGPGGYSEFLNSTWGTQMIIIANKTAQAAAALLQSHCPLSLNGPHHPATWKVDVLNYDEPAMRTALVSDFGVNPSGFSFGSMYKNTMVYDRLLHLPDTQYLWHSDADMRVYRIAEDARPNFVEASISLLRSDNRVIMTRPLLSSQLIPSAGAVFNSTLITPTCGTQPDTECHDLNCVCVREFEARWYQGVARSTTYISVGTRSSEGVQFQWASVQMFLMDVQKFGDRVLPFDSHLAPLPFEQILMPTFSESNVVQAVFGCGTDGTDVVAEHDSKDPPSAR